MTRAAATRDQKLTSYLQALDTLNAGGCTSNQATAWRARLEEKVRQLEEQGATPSSTYWPMGIRDYEDRAGHKGEAA